MKYSNESYGLRIELDTKQCELSPGEIAHMEKDLGPLRRVAGDFPISDLYITVIHHPPSKNFHVKTALVLTGKTLFTGDRDEAVHPAWERCVWKLVRKVEAYKAQLESVAEVSKRQKGTRQEVAAEQLPDHQALRQAFESGDYAAFRAALLPFEESLRKRIGRWVQRYPDMQAMIDVEVSIEDIVEEVFLNAFEQFGRHPEEVSPGEWLEGLIDPSIKALLRHPDDELENVAMARTLRDVARDETARRGGTV
ncbi:MAG: hypothetical protein WD069_21315 [Planctomycetales bacterium]